MSPETDLAVMLASITVTRRGGVWTMVTVADDRQAAEVLVRSGGVDALIREDEGLTAVVETDIAASLGALGEFRGAWLTLDVHSSLHAIGLTAAVSEALAEVGIACNVLAGHHHDHLLVPVERADDAIAAIEALRTTGAS